MTELNTNEWALGGVDLDAAGLSVLSVEGIEGSAPLDEDSTENFGDGEHPGIVRVGPRIVTLRIGVTADTTESSIDALRTVVAPTTDRVSRRLARFRHRGVTKRFLYRPAPGTPLVVPGDVDYLVHHWSDAIVARIKAADGVLYADAPTVTTFSAAGQTKTVANAGTLAATGVSAWDLGAMSWSITAGGGGCVRPYLAHADHPGERWVLPETLTAGQVVSVDCARVTRIGATVVHKVEGAGGCPVATWPVLRPGNNAFTIGCQSGALTASLTTRSTWS